MNLPGLTPEMLAAHVARVGAFEQAAVKPLPGALMAAFAMPDSISNGRRYRAVTLGDFPTFIRLRHPLAEAHVAAPGAWTAQERWEAAWLFRTPPARCRALAAMPHRLRRRAALAGLGRRWPQPGWFAGHVRRGFCTQLPFEADGTHIGPGECDGPGWWLILLGSLVRDYHFTLEAALDCPLAVAFALRAHGLEGVPGLHRAAPGYIGQQMGQDAEMRAKPDAETRGHGDAGI